MLENQISFVDLIISAVTGYDQQVKEAVKLITRKNKQPIEQIETHVFCGRTPHGQVIDKMLDFMQFIIIGSEFCVTLRP